MKKDQLKKMIKEEILEAISYNTMDKVLDALIKGKITKSQAKRYINDINKIGKQTTSEPGFKKEKPSKKSSYTYDGSCGSNSMRSC